MWSTAGNARSILQFLTRKIRAHVDRELGTGQMSDDFTNLVCPNILLCASLLALKLRSIAVMTCTIAFALFQRENTILYGKR